MARCVRCVLQFAIVAAAMAFSHPGFAQTATGCRVQEQNGRVAVVICPRGLTQEQWREAGEQACVNRKPCNAFIWDDAKNAPSFAPKYPTEVPHENFLAAVSIWDNDTKQMYIISKAK